MQILSRYGAAFILGMSLAALPVHSQILPKDANVPVEVVKGTGDFAKLLNGAKMPTGKGWKAISDMEKRLQLMVPDKWRLDASNQDCLFRVFPPSSDKVQQEAALVVTLTKPRDADPIDVDEKYALNYADELVNDKNTESLHLAATDSGWVHAHGMKFALGGWTMKYGMQAYRQQQLVYISEDRIVSIQFTCHSRDFEKYAQDLAKIFASYQNLGVIKAEAQ